METIVAFCDTPTLGTKHARFLTTTTRLAWVAPFSCRMKKLSGKSTSAYDNCRGERSVTVRTYIACSSCLGEFSQVLYVARFS